MRKTLIVSDIHLGCKFNNKERFLELLKSEKFDRLIINGDFVDGWRIKRNGPKHLDKTDLKIFKKILVIAKHKDVILIKGNHDDFMSEFVDTSIGNITICDFFVEDGILFVHGDCFDAFTVLGNGMLAKIGDLGYNILLRLNWIFRLKKYSLSSMIKQKVKKVATFIGKFEDAACIMAYEKNCHTIVCGHIHTPEDKEITLKNKKIRYMNSGDWQEGSSYIMWEGKNLSLVENFVDKSSK
jgi:UDP-2,3-diacylglucosamine pyrophosphatase LpxH